MKLNPPQVILVMGVSGCGKTTVGKLLADRLEGTFLDADDLHPMSNIDKMSRGEPLNDDDRWPWLDAVAQAVQEREKTCVMVLACSALKVSYRTRLRLPSARIIFLTGPYETIQQRLQTRAGHYMTSQLLDSQLETLDEPDDAIVVSIVGTPTDIVDHLVQVLVK